MTCSVVALGIAMLAGAAWCVVLCVGFVVRSPVASFTVITLLSAALIEQLRSTSEEAQRCEVRSRPETVQKVIAELGDGHARFTP
ncbi:MAG: hypothetical protein JWN04_5018 [Myxococcaceae bacterium]|nr:hypothetical protein [Myxococcaceae bacterium]